MNGLMASSQLLEHQVEGEFVHQRLGDGYINATAMCKASGKKWNDYYRLSSTNAYLSELSAVTGIPATDLIQVIQGGTPELQDTWVHPQVSINLGQWLSPQFAVLVSEWFVNWISGNIKHRPEIPYHIRRYIANRSEVPYTHFSVFNELVFGLIAPMEEGGYTLPENMLPDISEGKMFSNWLRKEKGIDPKGFSQYTHCFEDGRLVKARLYPNELLGDFRGHFYNVWLPQRATDYFAQRDPKALTYLPEVIQLSAKSNQTFERVNSVSKPALTKQAKAPRAT